MQAILADNCDGVTGNGDILVEWRQPVLVHGEVDYYVLYYKSPEDVNYYKRRIDAKRYREEAQGSFVAQLTNMHNFTTYKLAVSAVTKSTKAPGKLYESQFSSYHQIFVSPGCTVPSEMVSVFARCII